MSKYFNPMEFRRCTPPCFETDMDKHFLSCLDSLRERLGMPIIINSAYRSPEYEKGKKRTGSSSHCKGIAVDIHVPSPIYAHKLVQTALELFPECRLGIATNYIHFDLDESKNPAIWVY